MGIKKLKAFRVKLSAASDKPPSEFRIFKKGENQTSKDERPFIFDETAAVSVMAKYAAHGVDIAIDREHLSLDQESKAYDPDARGWCNLELRDGDLWAVNVRWTPDGERRLREKTQRYISPVFEYNKETMQILSLYNIAICAIPATHEAPPLVAASKRCNNKLAILSVEVKKMDVLKAVCAALGLKEDSTLDEALAAIKAMQEPDGDEQKKDEAAADEPGDEAKMTKALSKLPPKIQGVVRAALSAKDSLTKRLDEMERKQAVSEREALIAANTNKIPLHLEKWARDESTPLIALRSFLAAAVPVARPATPPQEQGSGPVKPEDVKLTPEDIEMAKLTGTPKEKILAHKKAKAAELAQA